MPDYLISYDPKTCASTSQDFIGCLARLMELGADVSELKTLSPPASRMKMLVRASKKSFEKGIKDE